MLKLCSATIPLNNAYEEEETNYELFLFNNEQGSVLQVKSCNETDLCNVREKAVTLYGIKCEDNRQVKFLSTRALPHRIRL